MPWFVTSLMTHDFSRDDETVPVRSREYWCTVFAPDRSAAYLKSLSLGPTILDRVSAELGRHWAVDGVSELVALLEEPAPGVEILWEQSELRPEEVGARIKPKESLSVFAAPPDPGRCTGWYLGELVHVEVHDTGTHGETVLVWINSHLIEASDDESAYVTALELGNEHNSEPASHRCDEDSAHWEFRGLRNLTRILGPPRDGAILWFDERHELLEDVRAAVPRRDMIDGARYE